MAAVSLFWNTNMAAMTSCACAPLAISELPFASVSKRVLVQNFSYENEFDEVIGEPYFHNNGLARRLLLTQR